MRRGFCKAFSGLLASTGLALGLSSPAFAQARPTAPADTIASPRLGSEGPAAPAAVAPAPPLGDAAGLTTSDCGQTDRPSRWYGGAESLLWWFKGSPVPVPLLTTTSNPNAMPVAALDDPNASVLLGNQHLDTGAHWGARFTAGYWIDERQQIAVEGSYLFLTKQTTVRTVASTGQPDAPILAVPFADQDAGIENSFVIASPGSFAGSATLSVSSRLQGAEMQFAVQAFDGNQLHVQVLAGFRYLDLTESLRYATASTGLSDPNTDLVLNTVDQFDMRNQFYGFQVGARADYRLGNLEISAIAKLALGDMSQTGNFNGFAVTNFFNGPAGGPFTGVPTQNLPGSGIFVQPSNLGSASRDEIAWAPEFGVNVAYQLTRHLRVFAGYDFLYLSNVIRPGQQIDRGINVSQTVQTVIAGNAAAPGTRPAVTLSGSDFWAQGINLGLEFRY
jgi:hypothetical protein